MEKWFGIDRDKIEWFPTIDYEKCIGCMACVRKCTHRVYEEEDGKPKVVGKLNCVVGCTNCEATCPVEAISHPPKEGLLKLAKQQGCGCGGCR